MNAAKRIIPTDPADRATEACGDAINAIEAGSRELVQALGDLAALGETSAPEVHALSDALAGALRLFDLATERQ